MQKYATRNTNEKKKSIETPDEEPVAPDCACRAREAASPFVEENESHENDGQVNESKNEGCHKGEKERNRPRDRNPEGLTEVRIVDAEDIHDHQGLAR
jgi:hypothetical protein